MLSIDNANISSGTRVFVRCDIDVPIENDKVIETFRLDKCIPTLEYIIQKGGYPIIAGHMGKPEGQVLKELSTKILLPYFNEKLGNDKFKLLENLRFDPREETNDPAYAQELAMLSDIYINEAFSTSHREHASIIGIPQIIPSYAGFHLQEEIKTLSKLLDSPSKPLVVIIGGAKIESKKPVISKFLTLADYVLVGGKIGLDWDENIPSNLILPLDYVDDKDIGKQTISKFEEIISDANTILWAGPMGMYEEDKYSSGTKEILEAVTNNTDAFSIVGGGDVVTAVDKFNALDKFNFVSTGGGSMLQFLAKSTLPGIEVLNKDE